MSQNFQKVRKVKDHVPHASVLKLLCHIALYYYNDTTAAAEDRIPERQR